MARTRYKDIEQLINTPEVIEDAESQWRNKQANRNKFAKWLDWFIKIALPIVAIVFYLQSAPHTAGMANRLTRGFGLTAPVGFEFMIFLLSVAMDRGLRKDGLKVFYVVAIVLTATLTIGGSIFSVMETAGNEMVEKSFTEILDTFFTLPFINQFLLIFVIPYGIFVTLSAKIIAELGIGVVTGDIQLNKSDDNIELKWTNAQTDVYKNALYLAATKAGVSPKLAAKWATNKAISLTDSVNTEDEIKPINSDATVTRHVIPEMGFATQMRFTANDPSRAGILRNDSHDNDSDATVTQKDYTRNDIIRYIKKSNNPDHLVDGVGTNLIMTELNLPTEKRRTVQRAISALKQDEDE